MHGDRARHCEALSEAMAEQIRPILITNRITRLILLLQLGEDAPNLTKRIASTEINICYQVFRPTASEMMSNAV
jgi:hypothetical protein